MPIGNRIKNLEVPIGDKALTIGMAILNFFLPGIGTLIMGAVADNKDDMIIGLLQFLLAFLIIGWIWSIVWGVLMIIRV
ncbi:MAG: uncharacterized protein KVP18_003381 [Porospora cf. gigantea A]|uniref:uncharacterized protein n=1 Tax=Porospora cf. gigantea A TaxID=2853593 RepID=UPI00355A6EB5|nr:MAG: hypothetical protein KVP18_003381 [Porospora cf. gigantea A]